MAAQTQPEILGGRGFIIRAGGKSILVVSRFIVQHSPTFPLALGPCAKNKNARREEDNKTNQPKKKCKKNKHSPTLDIKT
ncbi:MAG: hypothetical protein AAF357_04565, partial [Verrucomicrobiota bacterium]